MKYLLLIAALLLAGCQSKIDHLNQVMDTTVVQLGDYCSGIIIDKEQKLILSANHCLQDSDRSDITLIQITQRTWDAEHKEDLRLDTWARVIAFDEEHDIAVLQLISGTLDSEAALSTEGFQRGQRVYTAGNPLGFPMFLGEGIITSANYFFSEDLWMITHSATMAPGNSGGALLNEHGQLVGLTNWSMSLVYGGMVSVPTGHYIALPIEYVVRFLDEKQIKI